MDKIIIGQKSGEQPVLPPVKKHAYFYIVFISAFLGALLLWFYAIGYDSTIFERKITNVPVTVTGLEQLRANREFMLADELVLEITVTVSGKRSVIYGLGAKDLVAVVDVSAVEQAGNNTLPITVTAPNGIGIRDLSSASVILYLDNFITKTVPVNVIYTDYILPESLKLGETEVNPIVATIEGPAGELERINAAYVQLSLGVISGPIAAYNQLFLKYDDGALVDNKYIRLSSQEAYVYISVYKEKTVPVVVLLNGGVFTAESAVITLSRETITISGSIDLIDSIGQIVIEVDETAFDLGKTATVTRYFSSLLPAGISIESGDVLVTATITIPDVTKRTFYIPPASVAVVRGNTEGTVTVESGVTISVIGLRDVLSEMNADSIIASVDAEVIFVNDVGDTVAYVDFTFADGISAVYVYGIYTVRTSTQ